MTKTLTEQWREGTIEDGFYYILFASRFGKDYIAIDMFISDEKDFMYSSCEDVKDVLAPVPSYDKYNKLRKLPLKCFQLEEDNSALMVINKDMCKEIERLQERLNECEEALVEAYDDCYDEGFEPDLAKEYLKKWGVK